MTAIKQGMLWLLLAGLLALACWMGYRTYGEQMSAEQPAPVDARYVDHGRYTEM